jgi:hypothetical protein
MIKRYSKNETLLVALAYAALICLVYVQVVFLGKTLLPSLYATSGVTHTGAYQYNGRRPINTFNIDLATPAYYENPINRLVGDTYLQGELPLWNPYQAAGTPLAAQYSTRAFFPYQIVEDLSPYWMWDFFMLGRLWIAGFFTFLFLRTIGLSIASSFLGGVFFMLSGSMTWFINLEQFVNVAMLVPVALLAMERLIRTRSNRHTALTGIVLALILLAGQPETALYLFLMLACYISFRLVKIRKDRASINTTVLRLFISGMIGFGISAPLWIPFIEFMGLSHNIHPIGGTMGVGSAPLFNAPAIITPTFFDLPISFPTGPQNGRWDLLGGYCGFLAFYLSIVGILFRSRHNGYALLFGLFGLFILLKNFGFPIVTWLGYLPLFDQVWTPRWAGPIWTFCFAVTGAIGLEAAENWLSEPDKSIEASSIVTHMISSLRGRIGFDQVSTKIIYVLIILSFCGVLLTGSSFGKAYTYWCEVARSIEQLPTTNTVKKQFKRLLAGDAVDIEFIGPSDVTNKTSSERKEIREAFKRINTMKNKVRTLWKPFCLQLILFFALLLWFRLTKGSKPTLFIMSPKMMIASVTVTSCLCLAVLYFLNLIDLSIFVPALTSEEGQFFVPSVLGGLFVTFSTMAIISMFLLLFRDGKNSTYAIVALGIVELWFFIPRGYDANYLYWKLVPFVAAIIGVFAMARKRRYWAVSAFFCMVITYTWIDIKSPHGLPERYNPFNQPPYVDFVKNDNDFGRIMALGGTLMPNFSSAFQLQDIRYVNALSLKDYHRHMGHLFSFYSRHSHKSSSLWFTGMSTTQFNTESKLLAELWDNLPYSWLLGVKYILTPDSMNLNFLPLVYQGEVNIYEMPFFIPRAFVAHQFEYASSPEQATDRVRALGRELANRVVLEKMIPKRYGDAVIGSQPDSFCSIEAYGSNRVLVKTRLERPGILVLTDVFYPGWKAYVDGKPTEVFRVDGLVRGVPLEKGSHTVVFRYLPDTFLTGMIIAAISFACSIVLLCLSVRKVHIVADQQTKP